MIVNSKADYNKFSRTEIKKKKRYAENISKNQCRTFFFQLLKTSNYCPIWQNDANVEA